MEGVASSRYSFVLFAILVALLSIHGCGSSSQKIELKTEYQAVFLDNGQVFFGKVDLGPEFVTLRDVFYIQSAMSKENKEVRNILLKRGQEWHGPEFMHINKTHVVLIEPVAQTSQVAKLITEAEKQKAMAEESLARWSRRSRSVSPPRKRRPRRSSRSRRSQQAAKSPKPGGAAGAPGKGKGKGGAAPAGAADPAPKAREGTPRLQTVYLTTARPGLAKAFGLANPHQVPRPTKIVLNVGLGHASKNPKQLEAVVAELAAISGQRPVVTKAKKAIANFNLRQGVPVGAMVTMRGARMYEILDRFITLALPRTRDFRGLPDKSFDGRGDYSFGRREQLTFPEIANGWR